MTNKDGFPITATSATRRWAITRMRGGEGASRRRTIGDLVASGRLRARLVRNPQSALRAAAKFSALQSLENSRNGETISILREPVPQAGGTPGAEQEGASAGGAARQNQVAWKWRRNGLKRLNPGARMVWARKSRTYNIWYPGAWLACDSGRRAAAVAERLIFLSSTKRNPRGRRPRLQWPSGGGEIERKVFRPATP
jgi:hypothetical protein